MCNKVDVCEEGWRWVNVWVWAGGGLLWALQPAIIRLSLGVSLINAAFLQLTSKVTGIVGTQPLPFAAAPEGSNGHITCFPRGFFTLFFLFSLFSSVCLSFKVFSFILSDSLFILSFTISFSLYPCLSSSQLSLPALSNLKYNQKQ